MNFQLNYTHPWLLLLLVPALALTLIPHFRVAKKYRRNRNRVISLTLHLLAMVLAVNLLAGLSFTYEVANTENQVILLVDASHSGEEQRDRKNEFVQSVINVCDKDFRVGVVKFGFDQKYVAELSHDPQEVFARYLESEDPDTSATDLASALKYAATLFENPETAKIVVISDGIETDGAATSVIKAIAAKGIKVDTVCFPNASHDELQLVSANTPEQGIDVGEEFTVELVLQSTLATPDQDVKIKLFDNGREVGAASVVINKAETVVPVPIVLGERGMHELRFEVETAKDTLTQNNAYHMFVNLETFDRILLIERYENESAKLQEILNEVYDVTAVSVEQDLAKIPTDLHEMAQYEQLILVNIAYSDMPAGFEALLNQYVYDLGGGLFTVGGRNETVNGEPVPHAYNREDLAHSTFYKQMLPINAVDFTPPIAVMIVVDASASMSAGNKLSFALQGAEGCLDALNDRDFCGVVSFQRDASEIAQVLPVSQKEQIRDAIHSIQQSAGDTVFSKAIMMAGRALSVIQNVERKHIILVTDGDPGDPYETYVPYIENNLKDDITMSIVTVNIESEFIGEMEDAATAGGGKFYNVSSADLNSIPTTMKNDLTLQAIAEIEYGEAFVPTIKDKSDVTAGVTQESIPPLTGYYGTVAKQDAVVPLMGEYVPIYARWQYGEGNVGSFMSDLNGEWSALFVNDLIGRAIVTNIVDDLFPTQDVRADGVQYELKTDNYTNQLSVFGVAKDHRVQVTVTPVSEALADLREQGIAVDAAESNRRFTFVIKDAGLYEIVIRCFDQTNLQIAEVTTYRTFSYSEEFNAFTAKEPIGDALLAQLAANGKGVQVEDPVQVFQSFALRLTRKIDPRTLFLILIIVFVLLDIAVRKFQFKWPHELIRERKLKKTERAE